MAENYAKTEERPFQILLQKTNGSMVIYSRTWNGTEYSNAASISPSMANMMIMNNQVHNISASDAWIVQYLGQGALNAQNTKVPEIYEITLNIQSAASAITKAAEVFDRLNLLNKFGWDIVSVNAPASNVLKIEIEETGSIAITTLIAIIVGLIALMFATKLITYSIIKKSENKAIEATVTYKNALFEAKNAGIITPEEYAALLEDVNAPLPTGTDSSWTSSIGDMKDLLMYALGGFVVLKLIEKV